jgi:hypothetical protein
MMASIRIMSGVMLLAMLSAWLPSNATNTVSPAVSKVSLIMPRDSGESSTTSTTSLLGVANVILSPLVV